MLDQFRINIRSKHWILNSQTMFSQSLAILTILTALLPLTNTQKENTKLDILKADILTHVIEKEKNNEETDTALQILQFILGNKQGNSRTEWVAAKDLIRRDNNELYKSSEDEIDDFIGLYEVRCQIEGKVRFSVQFRTIFMTTRVEQRSSSILIFLPDKEKLTTATSSNILTYLQAMVILTMITSTTKN